MRRHEIPPEQWDLDVGFCETAFDKIRVSLAEPASVDMPAFVGTVTLRYSRPLTTPSPSAAAPSASSVP